jgi:hypothetical protein
MRFQLQRGQRYDVLAFRSSPRLELIVMCGRGRAPSVAFWYFRDGLGSLKFKVGQA